MRLYIHQPNIHLEILICYWVSVWLARLGESYSQGLFLRTRHVAWALAGTAPRWSRPAGSEDSTRCTLPAQLIPLMLTQMISLTACLSLPGRSRAHARRLRTPVKCADVSISNSTFDPKPCSFPDQPLSMQCYNCTSMQQSSAHQSPREGTGSRPREIETKQTHDMTCVVAQRC